MSAIVSAEGNRWKDHVPYVFGDGVGKIWLLGKILEFNTRVGHNVFVPRTDERDYARFIMPGANSPIGMQGNEQVLRCNQSNLFHEMGHCVGLGHTYFHTRARLPDLFERVDRNSFLASRGIYADQGFSDIDSMMGYSPQSFLGSPRISRVCMLCANNRRLLTRAQRALQTLIELRGQAPAATVAAKFRVALQIPGNFNRRAMPFKVGGHWVQTRVTDYDDLRALDPDDLAQFSADITTVKDYWTFDAGFMMRVSDDDVRAIRAVLRL